MNFWEIDEKRWKMIIENIPFTELERNIMCLKRKGVNNLQISFKLYASERTISRAINKIKDKILIYLIYNKL